MFAPGPLLKSLDSLTPPASVCSKNWAPDLSTIVEIVGVCAMGWEEEVSQAEAEGQPLHKPDLLPVLLVLLNSWPRI